jgi:hypothetical protein
MVAPADEYPHPGAVDEWVFAAWAPDASVGLVSGHRLMRRRSWYWFALVHAGYPMLQVSEWDVAVRADPFTVKAPEMWAEHHCVAPLEQWTVANEAHAVALDEAAEALGRGYGTVTPMASDVEWYATGPPTPIAGGYAQDGVAHGLIELLDRPNIEWAEVPARRWRRWGAGLAALRLEPARAHTGLRAPFAFPDHTVADWVLTPDGWRSR